MTYNSKTKTLIIPYNYNDDLSKLYEGKYDNIEIIKFEEAHNYCSLFN